MNQSFGQFCPVALASEVLTQRWMLLVVRELLAGSARFNDIRRGVPRISATLLKQRLDTLVYADIVVKKSTGKNEAAEYHLTRAGKELGNVLYGIGVWGQRWARDIEDGDLDPGWLVWNIHRRMDVGAMPAGNLVIQIEFTDVPRKDRFFWLVKHAGKMEVCIKNPGYAVDLHVFTPVRVLAEVWRGIRNCRQELKAGAIKLAGEAKLQKVFPDWLLLSVYAPVKRER